MLEFYENAGIWLRALLLTGAVTGGALLVGFLMGRLRHLVIEGLLTRLLGQRLAIFVGYYLTVFGTLHHELAHAAGYLLTGARVHKISVFPRRQADGSVRLGYVLSSTRGPLLLRAVQDTVGSTGPLTFGFLTVYLLWSLALPRAATPWMTALVYYMMISVVLHMELSGADLKLLRRGLLPSLLLLYAIFLLVLRF